MRYVFFLTTEKCVYKKNYILCIFDAEEIEDHINGGETILCPYYGIDSIIG